MAVFRLKTNPLMSRGRTMAERFIVIGGSLFFSFGAFYFCRQSCAYYDTLRWNAFLRIRSDFVCWLFISPAVKARNGINRGRLLYAAPQDEHKITVLGLLSHLIVDSLAIRYIFVSVQYGLFQMQPFDAVQKAAVYLVLAAMTAAIASTINQSKVG